MFGDAPHQADTPNLPHSQWPISQQKDRACRTTIRKRSTFGSTLTELCKQAATLVIQWWAREAAAVQVVTRFVNSGEAQGDVRGVRRRSSPLTKTSNRELQ